MSRGEVRDAWHTSRGDARCPECKSAAGLPNARHGQPKRWVATWDEYVDGKRVQRKESFRNPDDAADYQRRMRTAVSDKSLPPGFRPRRGSVTVSGYFPRFMELTKGNRFRGGNSSKESSFRNQIGLRLGERDMADLQHEPLTIRDWQRQLKADGYAGTTIANAFTLLKSMFEYARGETRDTGVTINPCLLPQAREGGKVARRRARRESNWTAEKLASAYLAPMPAKATRGSEPVWQRYRAALLLAATCGGMRWCEVTGLDPADIDWGNRLITMNHSVIRDYKGNVYFKDGKSEAAHRVMTATPLALNALSLHMARYEPVTLTLRHETPEMRGVPIEEWPWLTRSLIFATSEGKPVISPVFQSAARYGLNRAGLLEAKPIEPRYKRDKATGRYLANGGQQRTAPSQRYESPTSVGLHAHAMRHFWNSLMEHRGIPLTIRTDEVGHEANSSLRSDGGHGPDLNLDVYSHPIPGAERAMWRRRVREIITDEFGPFLPDLLTQVTSRPSAGIPSRTRRGYLRPA